MLTDTMPEVDLPDDHIAKKTQDLEEARKVVVGDAPVMERPSEGKVSLSFGLLVNGEYEKDAEVRELTGADEEALAKYTTYMELVDAIICRATVRIGSLDLSSLPLSERQTKLGFLLAGDRELLFLGIIAATYGNERDIPYTCPHCEALNEVTTIITEDFRAKDVDDLRDTYEYVTNRGETVVYRLSNGHDLLHADRKKGATVPQVNSMILAECILSVNGEPPLSPMEFVLSMGMNDRRVLLESMEAHQPGVNMVLDLKCPTCNETVNLSVAWEDVFRF